MEQVHQKHSGFPMVSLSANAEHRSASNHKEIKQYTNHQIIEANDGFQDAMALLNLKNNNTIKSDLGSTESFTQKVGSHLNNDGQPKVRQSRENRGSLNRSHHQSRQGVVKMADFKTAKASAESSRFEKRTSARTKKIRIDNSQTIKNSTHRQVSRGYVRTPKSGSDVHRSNPVHFQNGLAQTSKERLTNIVSGGDNHQTVI